MKIALEDDIYFDLFEQQWLFKDEKDNIGVILNESFKEDYKKLSKI